MSASEATSQPSVLIAFRAENVRSFRDDVELNMLATSLAEDGAPRSVPWRTAGSPIHVLPAAGIFGANASGKTAILRAMSDMRDYVLHSFRTGNPMGGIPRVPFRLSSASAAAPSRFEIDIVLSGVRHEYGFVIDDMRVREEWAFHYPHGRSAMLFYRNNEEINLGPPVRSRGRAAVELIRPNALFLSTAAAAHHPVLIRLFQWFSRNLLLAEADTRHRRQALTAELLDDPARRDLITELLQVADLGVTGAKKHPVDPEMRDRMNRAVRILTGQEGDLDGIDDSIDFEHLDVRLTHRGQDNDIEMHADDESLGTLVWFGLVGPLVQALADGAVLLVDELDASLHPDLAAHLIRMFQRAESNPHRAQLIFNTHDAMLLGDAVSDRLLGRDQIWFTEKNSDGSTRMYPLSDLKPRKEESLARRYLAGRYGGTPILSTDEFDALAERIAEGANP